MNEITKPLSIGQSDFEGSLEQNFLANIIKLEALSPRDGLKENDGFQPQNFNNFNNWDNFGNWGNFGNFLDYPDDRVRNDIK